MKYLINVKIELIAPDEVLQETGRAYHSMERDISLMFLPYPGLVVRIKADIGEVQKQSYSELMGMISNKTGVFEVDRCVVDVDSDCSYDLTVILKSKREESAEAFLALPEFLKFYGFSTC